MLGGRLAATPGAADSPLRIVGGKFRGRKLRYSGDPRTRPMKDRVREAAFNLLGPAPQGKHVIDLFAGTGALALEALSRGAVSATLIERHFPTAAVIRENLAVLGCEALVEVVAADTFYWAGQSPQLPADRPWLVFCSPPYEFYVCRVTEMLQLIGRLVHEAPAESQFVVEADERFDAGTLPEARAWQTRSYPPAHLHMYCKTSPQHSE